MDFILFYFLDFILFYFFGGFLKEILYLNESKVDFNSDLTNYVFLKILGGPIRFFFFLFNIISM